MQVDGSPTSKAILKVLKTKNYFVKVVTSLFQLI